MDLKEIFSNSPYNVLAVAFYNVIVPFNKKIEVKISRAKNWNILSFVEEVWITLLLYIWSFSDILTQLCNTCIWVLLTSFFFLNFTIVHVKILCSKFNWCVLLIYFCSDSLLLWKTVMYMDPLEVEFSLPFLLFGYTSALKNWFISPVSVVSF